MAAKVLITGLPNSGKTSLIKDLDGVFVFSRDGKQYPFKNYHVNIPDFNDIKEVIDLCIEKVNTYKAKVGELPKTIVFDSVSRLFTDIETCCNKKYNGFEVWKNVNKQVNILVDFINQLVNSNINVVIIAHAVYDSESGTFTETCKGSFAKVGGFLSVVDYAIYIEIKGSKRVVNHRGKYLSRCLLPDIADSQDANSFKLQEYIDSINEVTNEVTEKWSI